MNKNLYLIVGCNGAGKTTASFTILPEILDCKEFANADKIAKGLSPFQPEKVSFESGSIMKVHKMTPTQTKIMEGMDKVYEKLIEFKRKNNSYLVIIQDGKIVKIKP